MTLSFWWRLHLLGWHVWATATLVFASFVLWAWPLPKRRALIPWGFLLVLLVSVLISDLGGDWQRVFLTSRRIWGAGILALATTSALPLALCVACAPWAEKHLSRFPTRLMALVVPALIVRLVLGAYLSHWIQRGLLD